MTKISDKLGYFGKLRDGSLLQEAENEEVSEEKKVLNTLAFDKLARHTEYYNNFFYEDLGAEFPAGRMRKDYPGAYGHGDIEDFAFGEDEATKRERLFNTLEINQIYLGNWLRDFSQMVVGAIVKGKEFYNKDVKTNIYYSSHVNDLLTLRHKKIEHQTLVDLIKIAAIKEFVYDPKVEKAEEDETLEKPRNNYEEYVEEFESNFHNITKDSLGMYRPEEHLDNPKRLPDESGLGVHYIYEYMSKTDRIPRKKVAFLYNGESKPVPPSEVGESFKITQGYNTKKSPFPPNNFKKFIVEDVYANKEHYLKDAEKEGILLKALIDDELAKLQNKKEYDHELFEVAYTQDKKLLGKRPAAVTYMLEQFRLAAYYGQNKKGCMHFGAGLHVLEDFYAHSNFCELSLIKYGKPKTHPFVIIFNEEILEQQKQRGIKVNDFPLVTGLFALDDTIVSIVPKLAEVLFSLDIEDYKRRKAGDRTFTEVFIAKVLEDRAREERSILQRKDISDAEKQKKIDEITVTTPHIPLWGKSTFTPTELLNDFNWIMDGLDWLADAKTIKEEDDFLDRFFKRRLQDISEAIFYILQQMGFYISSVVRPFLDVIPDVIIASQEFTNENYGEQGNDPTHSQIAKDDPHHHLNGLAGELAVAAVREVGIIMKGIWEKKPNVTLSYLERVVTEKYIQHPAQTDWMKSLVEFWIDDHLEEIERAEYKNALDYTKALGNRAIEKYSYDHEKHEDLKKWLDDKIKELNEMQKPK